MDGEARRGSPRRCRQPGAQGRRGRQWTRPRNREEGLGDGGGDGSPWPARCVGGRGWRGRVGVQVSWIFFFYIRKHNCISYDIQANRH